MENIKQVFSPQRFVHPFYIIFFLFIFSGNHSFSQNASIGEKKFEGTHEMNNLLSEYVKKADFNNLGGLILNDQGVLFYKEKLKTATVDQYNYVRTEYANQLLLSGKVNESIEEVEKIMKEISVNENYKGPSKNILRNLLALCYFRLGEQENCILGNTAGSCIFPIQGDGIYKIKSPTRKALSLYNEILADDSNDLESRWILNLGYMVLGIYPDSVPKRYLIPAHKFDSDYKIGKFKNVSQGLGLDLSSLAGSVCMEDFDNDGDLDLFVDNEDLVVPCKYFVNNGDGTFTEKTKEAGLMGIIGGRMASTADYNNDGFTDIFVTRGAWMADENNFPPNSLLKNNGDGTFSDVTIESEVLSFFPTSCASWADFNNDGYADLFVGNETTDQGSPHTCELYLNNGKGHFENVAKECGIVVNGFVKSVSWGDYNNDGWQDLYVSIIKGPNLLFKNNGKDTSGKVSFTEVSQQAGVTKPYYGFPAFFFDFDNDGWLDIYASAHSLGYLDISKIIPGEYLGNSSSSNNQTKLYHNNHNGTFTDISKEAHLDRVIYAMSCGFGDIDNDGFDDVYAGTGYLDLRYLFPNVMLRNAEGKFMQDVSASTGLGHIQKTHGISFGDIDNDGDQDIYVVLGGGFKGDGFMNALFLNPGNTNHWITLKLEGVKSNRSALGAKIKVSVETNSGVKDIFTTVADEGTLGTSSLQKEIGLGKARKIKNIEIKWPSGLIQNYKNIALDTFYKVKEGEINMVREVRKKIVMDKSTFETPLKMNH